MEDLQGDGDGFAGGDVTGERFGVGRFGDGVGTIQKERFTGDRKEWV